MKIKVEAYDHATQKWGARISWESDRGKEWLIVGTAAQIDFLEDLAKEIWDISVRTFPKQSIEYEGVQVYEDNIRSGKKDPHNRKHLQELLTNYQNGSTV